jgi:hypothetical protein
VALTAHWAHLVEMCIVLAWRPAHRVRSLWWGMP